MIFSFNGETGCIKGSRSSFRVKVWKPRFQSVVLADNLISGMRLRDFCLLMEGAKESEVSIP